MDNYAIINVYITEVMLFNEVSLRRFKVHLQNRSNRIKNGRSKIVVSKTSISALNTVDIANKSPFSGIWPKVQILL